MKKYLIPKGGRNEKVKLEPNTVNIAINQWILLIPLSLAGS